MPEIATNYGFYRLPKRSQSLGPTCAIRKRSSVEGHLGRLFQDGGRAACVCAHAYPTRVSTSEIITSVR